MLVAILSRKRSLFSTRRLSAAATRLGHEVIVLDPLQCCLLLDKGKPELTYRGLESKLPEIDVVLPRIGASITTHGLAVVKQFEMIGIPVVNASQPIARSRDKLRCLQLLSRSGIDIPRTVMMRHPSQVDKALETVGGPPAILKLIRGTQGIGVVLAETEQVARQILETFWGLGMNILVQEFIEESEGRDIRALVVGNRVVAAMRRQARIGEIRSNVHRGASGVPVRLPDTYSRAAVRAVRAMNLRFAGVDLLESRDGPKVMEINLTPGLEGLERCTGADLASTVIEYTVAFARRSWRRRRVAV